MDGRNRGGLGNSMPCPIPSICGQQVMGISRTMSTENEDAHSYAGLWNGFINSDWPERGVGHAV